MFNEWERLGKVLADYQSKMLRDAAEAMNPVSQASQLMEAAAKAVNQPLNDMLAQARRTQQAQYDQMIEACKAATHMPWLEQFNELTPRHFIHGPVMPLRVPEPTENAYTFARKLEGRVKTIRDHGKEPVLLLITPAGDILRVSDVDVYDTEFIHFTRVAEDTDTLTLRYRQMDEYQIVVLPVDRLEEEDPGEELVN